MLNLKYIGQKCQIYRQSMGYRQCEVARDTGYSIENISAFENGRNDNLIIFLWYLDKGFSIDKLKG